MVKPTAYCDECKVFKKVKDMQFVEYQLMLRLECGHQVIFVFAGKAKPMYPKTVKR